MTFGASPTAHTHNVDLPAPFGPTRPTTRPGSTDRFTPRSDSVVVPAYRYVTFARDSVIGCSRQPRESAAERCCEQDDREHDEPPAQRPLRRAVGIGAQDRPSAGRGER